MRKRKLPGKSVLDYAINSEPRGLLGRYFLRGEQLLIDAGLTPRVVGPKQLHAVNEANRATWPPLQPNLDYRVFPPRPKEIHAIVLFNKQDEAVATIASRRYDMRGTTLQTECDTLRFYYGPRAADFSSTVSFTVTAPCAPHITGIISYAAALWIRPDHRKFGATRIMGKLMRYFTFAQGEFDFEVLASIRDISPPLVALGYGLEGIERGFEQTLNGKLAYQGQIVWTSKARILHYLEQDVQMAEASQTLLEIGRRQQELFTASLERQ